MQSLAFFVAVLLLGPGAQAGFSLSASQQDAIVQKHNDLRAGMGAADMAEMVWDEALARKAQAWSNSCPGMHHSSGRARVKGAGENLAAKWASNLAVNANSDFTPSVQSWYDEKSDAGRYQWGGAFHGFGPCTGMCGHYTQVVWGVANKIGCGAASCPSSMPGYHLTCQYGTSVSGGYGGNMGGSTLFTRCRACSKCPSGLSKCSSNGLCSSGSSNSRQSPSPSVPAPAPSPTVATGCTCSVDHPFCWASNQWCYKSATSSSHSQTCAAKCTASAPAPSPAPRGSRRRSRRRSSKGSSSGSLSSFLHSMRGKTTFNYKGLCQTLGTSFRSYSMSMSSGKTTLKVTCGSKLYMVTCTASGRNSFKSCKSSSRLFEEESVAWMPSGTVTVGVAFAAAAFALGGVAFTAHRRWQRMARNVPAPLVQVDEEEPAKAEANE